MKIKITWTSPDTAFLSSEYGRRYSLPTPRHVQALYAYVSRKYGEYEEEFPFKNKVGAEC